MHSLVIFVPGDLESYSMIATTTLQLESTLCANFDFEIYILAWLIYCIVKASDEI